jgi:hypothetical protein
MQLKSIQGMGWKGMEMVVNRLIDAINANAPVEGAGIRLEQLGASGTIISAANSGLTTGGAVGSAGGTAAPTSIPGVPIQIQAFDLNNNPVTITVMTDGNGFSASTLSWQPVAVVDPATCAQSTITVLEKPSS